MNTLCIKVTHDPFQLFTVVAIVSNTNAFVEVSGIVCCCRFVTIDAFISLRDFCISII